MGAKVSFSTALTEVRFNPVGNYAEPLGTIRVELNATYKYVAFSGTTAIAAGDVVAYLAYASDGTATVVDGANSAMGAGVAQAAVALGTKASGALAYATGWIQIEGLATVSTALGGSPGLGDGLTSSSASAATLTKNAASGTSVVAICYDATAKKIMCAFPR